MRLLDLIVQARTVPVRCDDGAELPGADRYGEALRACPLRFVLSDPLTRCATLLAYAEGDRLSACLDLVHVPARSLWVEWSDAPRREVLQAIAAPEAGLRMPIRHGGALVSAAPGCRAGQIRTFWSTADDLAYLSPMVTFFDLDGRPSVPTAPAIWRGETRLRMEEEPALEEILTHLYCRLDEDWAQYYHARCPTEQLRAEVLRRNLGGCAFDAPMLMAFFLLLGARDLLPRQEVRHERLNAVRARAGRPALLEHVEVAAPIDQPPTWNAAPAGESARMSPRLHHVRGHIVRRGSAVYWRSPHLRGSPRLGQVRSRTVVLRFGPAAPEPARAYQ